eukprot:3064655-Rhodomonas_salina.1
MQGGGMLLPALFLLLSATSSSPEVSDPDCIGSALMDCMAWYSWRQASTLLTLGLASSALRYCYAMFLRAHYVMSGTDLACGAMYSRARGVVSGTERMVLRYVPTQISSTTVATMISAYVLAM